jgi:hypothetical protein
LLRPCFPRQNGRRRRALESRQSGRAADQVRMRRRHSARASQAAMRAAMRAAMARLLAVRARWPAAAARRRTSSLRRERGRTPIRHRADAGLLHPCRLGSGVTADPRRDSPSPPVPARPGTSSAGLADYAGVSPRTVMIPGQSPPSPVTAWHSSLPGTAATTTPEHPGRRRGPRGTRCYNRARQYRPRGGAPPRSAVNARLEGARAPPDDKWSPQLAGRRRPKGTWITV